jgi:hypothetical protein
MLPNVATGGHRPSLKMAIINRTGICLPSRQKRLKAEVWCYCLMPIAAIADISICECVSPVTFAKVVFRRFGSMVMGENHLRDAARYVSFNPVRAGLVRRASDWK